MSDIATCASCGEKKELCRSAKINGITQPRICKECLIAHLETEDKIDPSFWFRQMLELGDVDSLKEIRKQKEELT